MTLAEQDDLIREFVAEAKSWHRRGATQATVQYIAPDGQQAQATVAFGEQKRRRWARIAASLAGVQLVQATGLSADGALVGTWKPEMDDDDPHTAEEASEEAEEPDSEGDFERSHREHTRWVLKEASRMFESSQRLTAEMVGACVEVMRAVRDTFTRPPAPAMPVSEDEASKTLGMLLQAMMANHNTNTRSSDADAQDGGGGAHPDRQGTPTEQATPGA